MYTMEYYSVIKKEWNWVHWSDVDESRAFHMELSKSKRRKRILYIIAYIGIHIYGI